MAVPLENFALIPPQYPRMAAQEAENNRCIAALFELIESATSAAENFSSYIDSRLKPLHSRGYDLVSASLEMGGRYRHEAPCGWTEEKVMDYCDQKLSRELIAELLSRPSLDVACVHTVLQTLRDTSVEIPRGRVLLMRENLSTMKPHQPKGMVRSLEEICGALYDIQFVDLLAQLREDLADLDPVRDRAIAQVNEAMEAYKRAVAGGDVVEVERTHRQLITARYELVSVCSQRMQRLLTDELEKREKGFAAEMDALENDAREALRMFTQHHEDQRAVISEDIRKCDAKQLEEDTRHKECLEAYMVKDKELTLNLHAVIEGKQKLVEEMRQKALELLQLMEKQKEIVEAQITAKKEEERRITAYNEFLNFEGQQKARLLRCLEYNEQVMSLVPELTSYIEYMITKLPRSSLQEAMNTLNDAEAGDFMEAYSPFVACCGELTVKKMHRLDTLERQARLMEYNRNSSMESLDPNMNNYRTELENLIEQMKGVTGVINALNAMQDAGEQLFLGVEEGVRAKYQRAAVPFVHPLQVHGIKSVEERDRFITRSMQYVEDEERKVHEKKGVLSRMRRAVEEDEATTELALRDVPAARDQ
ncbi:putative Paraflagellar rod protein [Trypanosoma vivax]|nr:paraflagellar rod component [Trypanosoma vivax]KAH8604912.1 putative Paraflagellar rod protein [Trypanosoma vivax]